MALFSTKWILASNIEGFFLFSSEETNDYIAAFYLIGGVISIITGLIGLFLIMN